jgi:4-amino-4-deoxy-L-arabinose transferase-like glycosyltransferase
MIKKTNLPTVKTRVPPEPSKLVTPPQTLPAKTRWLWLIAVLVLFTIGIGLRFLNLTNPPLDVHGFRVLPSLMTARGMYYQMLPNADPVKRDLAISMIALHEEPPITERLVALTYLVVGSEQYWIFRLWTTLFWVMGGVGLFLLARGISTAGGALLALGYYLLLPFGIIESRAFLPEPLMLMLIIWALYALYRWTDRPTWIWGIAAGVLAGMAIYSKVFAVYFLGPAFLLTVLTAFGWRRAIKDPQVWTMVAIMALIPATFYIFPNTASGANYLGKWVFPFWRRLLDIWFYIQWLHILNGNFNLAFVLLAMLSTLWLDKRWRALCLGLWIGYALLGASVPELILSHKYYNIPLVAVVALGLAPAGALIFDKLAQQKKIWQLVCLGILLVGIAYPAYMARKEITANDYHAEVQRWLELGEKLPDSGVVGMTQDYEARLAYFAWKPNIKPYSRSYDQDMNRLAGNEFDVNADNTDYFNSLTEGSNYFVITELDQLEAQPYLKKILYEHYTIYDQADWYIIFDLTNPK